ATAPPPRASPGAGSRGGKTAASGEAGARPCTSPADATVPRSGGAAAQQPHGGAEREQGERDEDASLDGLELPEAAGRLVGATGADEQVPEVPGDRRHVDDGVAS